MKETYVCGICWKKKGIHFEGTKKEMEQHIKEKHPDTEISEIPVTVTYIKDKSKYAS